MRTLLARDGLSIYRVTIDSLVMDMTGNYTIDGTIDDDDIDNAATPREARWLLLHRAERAEHEARRLFLMRGYQLDSWELTFTSSLYDQDGELARTDDGAPGEVVGATIKFEVSPEE